MEERGSTTLKRGGKRQEWMETVTVLSRAVQTLLLGLFLPVPVLDSIQVGTPGDERSSGLAVWSDCQHVRTIVLLWGHP